MRYRMDIAYDGTGYAGWQIQRNAHTIQGEIEKALQIIFKKSIRVTGAGRTDAGVHATGQVAHFDCDDDLQAARLMRSLNGILLPTIRIKEIFETGSDFHARFSATAREYIYRIARRPTALYRHIVWQYSAPINLKAMQTAASLFTGERNFKSFCRTISEVENHTCDVEFLELNETADELQFRIKANRFLHGMVRAIIGTLMDVGRGKLTKEKIEDIFKSGDRRLAGMAAPARGLTLIKVYYSD